MLQIYPFHRFEKEFFAVVSNVTRRKIACDVFQRACKEFGLEEEFNLQYKKHVNEVFDEKSHLEVLSFNQNLSSSYSYHFIQYAKIYGYEAMQLSLLLHPVERAVALNGHDALTAWKIMNKAWTILPIIYNQMQTDNFSGHRVFHYRIISALKKQKLHTYIASGLHLLKNWKQKDLEANAVYYALPIFSSIAPCMFSAMIGNNEK